MFKYSKMNWDAIWSQTPEDLCSDELAYYYEGFPFVLDDLQQLPILRGNRAEPSVCAREGWAAASPLRIRWTR